MWNKPLNTLLRSRLLGVVHLRNFHHEFTQPELPKGNQQKEKIQVQSKFKVFRDEESLEIFDVEEERQRHRIQIEEEQELERDGLQDAYMGLNLKRGVNGVFDVEDLVEVLRKENADDIFVCSVPKELKYVDHMIVCSGRSYRHMIATAEFVRRMYKIKRTKGDILPKIEGENSRDWMAMDLGNIALHIFSPTAREEYDLESLWAIGSEYDRESHKPQDPLVELFEQHTFLLDENTNENYINTNTPLK